LDMDSAGAQTKLMIAWEVGGRDGETARAFMQDVGARLANKVQLTTDGHRAYLEAVEEVFGADVDYAMLDKLYGPAPEPAGRYSPAQCIGAIRKRVRRTFPPATSSVTTSPRACRCAGIPG